MGYVKRADGTIGKVNYRTRLKKPRGRRAHLLTPPLKQATAPPESHTAGAKESEQAKAKS